MKMTLRQAIEWIAKNDNPDDQITIEELSGTMTVALVADLWGRPAFDIAFRVNCYRRDGVHLACYRKLTGWASSREVAS